MKEYTVIKRSKKLKMSTQIRIGGRFTGTYAYIVYKRQKLQRGSLLHRESPIEDIRVAYSDDEKELPHKFEPVEGEGKIRR